MILLEMVLLLKTQFIVARFYLNPISLHLGFKEIKYHCQKYRPFHTMLISVQPFLISLRKWRRFWCHKMWPHWPKSWLHRPKVWLKITFYATSLHNARSFLYQNRNWIRTCSSMYKFSYEYCKVVYHNTNTNTALDVW